MASAEVTYAGAVAYPVGDLARGFKQMMEMVNVSRLSNAMRSAALMRRALHEALTHARARGLGRPLADAAAAPAPSWSRWWRTRKQPPRGAARRRHARPVGRGRGGRRGRSSVITTPLAKYWITQHARLVTAERR